MEFCRIRARGLALVVYVVASFFSTEIHRKTLFLLTLLTNAENWWLDQQKQLLPFLQIRLTSCLIIYWSEIIFFLFKCLKTSQKSQESSVDESLKKGFGTGDNHLEMRCCKLSSQEITEIFLSSNSVKSFAQGGIRTTDP